jgi:hypothetical protein
MSFDRKFVCDQQAEQVLMLAKEILGDSYRVIQVINLKLFENFELTQAKIEANIVEISDNKAKKLKIYGEGVGLVDACFDGMLKAYEKDYCSLISISIVDFSVSAHLDSSNTRQSDAHVSALLRIKNADAHEYAFECTTSSISHSSVGAVQEAIAFFINAESAYIRLYRALADAKERGRHDLIERYCSQMSTIVKATSYEALVSRLKSNKVS